MKRNDGWLTNPSTVGIAAGIAGISSLVGLTLGSSVDWAFLLALALFVGALCLACLAVVRSRVQSGRVNERTIPYVLTGVIVVGTFAAALIIDRLLG